MTTSQIKLMREVYCGFHRFNGRAAKTIRILESQGLVTARMEIIPRGRLSRYGERWTVTLTPAGEAALKEIRPYVDDECKVVDAAR